ncbi:lytic transglycosylase domain-containing protein [Silanimonas sp.]|uniref:lytic transglycosylase domain-containing protein n=1 Tax=Silanimonas sp. TaxID=1929290 RepID=UPI001BC59F5B|nr:lytic transglycosylase domain-containing protein [Silanimonas sp.]MBS3896352.1 lytic transglycosylase domain-containing protein [Silanimonas sp.]
MRLPTLSVIVAVLLILAAPAVRGESLAAQRGSIAAALIAAERGTLDPADARRYAGHPLGGWIEALAHERQLDALDAEALDRVLERLGEQPAATHLRQAWVRHVAAQGRWQDVLRHGRESSDADLQCRWLQARLATATVDAGWSASARRLWLSARAQPESCEPVFSALAARGELSTELRWQRIDLTAQAGNIALLRQLARGLPAAEQARAEALAAFLEVPSERARDWPREARSRAVIEAGLVRLARRDASAAEALLEQLAPVLPGTDPGHGRVRAAIALWSAAAFRPESARRLAAVPASAFDEALHGWAVREPLARGDLAAALRAIETLPSALRGQARWQYLEARLREDLGDPTTAAALFIAAARSPSFHGFLAADRAGLPYALCPREPSEDARLRREVGRTPALIRAIELFRLQRPHWAALEWQAAVAGMDDTRRVLAVRAAQRAGWFDRALFGLPATEAALLYYSLRFPLPHRSLLQRESERHGLETALVAGLTRAESAFMPAARSPADARGLMQLLPSTAERVARRQGLLWNGPASLFQPETNIMLGTAYLAQRIGDNGGLTFRAIAAYNAGQGAVDRWVAARPQLPADYWIETIPFHETRDYVPRVLAFSVIYDWRMQGRSRSITDRLEGRASTAPRDFACPAPIALPAS